MQASVYHPRVIVYEHGVGGKQLGQLGENMLGERAVGGAAQQLAFFAVGQRVGGYSFVG